jgi:hypothetical protein
VLFVVTTGGPTGTFNVTARSADSVSWGGGAVAVNQDFLFVADGIAANLVAPALVLKGVSTIASVELQLVLETYILERLGARLA